MDGTASNLTKLLYLKSKYLKKQNLFAQLRTSLSLSLHITKFAHGTNCYHDVKTPFLATASNATRSTRRLTIENAMVAKKIGRYSSRMK